MNPYAQHRQTDYDNKNNMEESHGNIIRRRSFSLILNIYENDSCLRALSITIKN